MGLEERLDASEEVAVILMTPSSGDDFGMSMGKVKNLHELGVMLGNWMEYEHGYY